MDTTKMRALLQERQDEIIKGIQGCIRIESVKGEATEQAPYGEGPRKALEYALELGAEIGFRTKNVGNRAGWVEFGDGEEMVAVLGHLDVVPLGEGWDYPGFEGTLVDGKLYGRGVLDDKGPTIGAIYALKAIADAGMVLDRRIRVIFGTDEEFGSSCIKYYIESGEEMPTLGFTPDGSYPLIFCEKGMTGMTVGKKKPLQGKIKILKFEGGEASNVVTQKCILEVEGKLQVEVTDGIRVLFENGTTRVEAEGRSAHGSTPELGENAAIKLLNAVKDNEFGGDFQQFMNFLLEKIGTETNGHALGIDVKDEETGETTLNIGVVKFNKEEISATLDIRYPKNGNHEMVYRNVSDALEKYQLEVLKNNQVDILYVSKESELVKKLMKVYKECTGRNEEPMAIGGGTYAKMFPNMVAFGPTFPGSDEKIHQPNECVTIENLMLSLELTAEAMTALAVK